MMRRLVFWFGVFVLLIFGTSSAFAEYYIVYPAAAGPCCTKVVKRVYHRPVHHACKKHKVKKVKRVKYYTYKKAPRRSHYKIDVYYYPAPCCAERVERCGCSAPPRCGCSAQRCNRSCAAIVEFSGCRYCDDGNFDGYAADYEWSQDRRTADDVYPDMNIDN